jgi:hypothetical protein
MILRGTYTQRTKGLYAITESIIQQFQDFKWVKQVIFQIIHS